MTRQTKCPNCQTIYPVPAAKLGDPNVRAKCGKCQQLFFLNANLIAPTAQPQTLHTPTHQRPVSQTATTAEQMPTKQVEAAVNTTKPTPTHSAVSSITPQHAPSQKVAQHTASQELSTPTLDTARTSATPKPTKHAKPLPSNDMIHDDMDDSKSDTLSTQVMFSDQELDNFLNENISSASYLVKSTKDEMADNDGEAWIENLLDESKNPTAQTQTAQVTSAPIIDDVDLNAIIPAAAPKAKKPLSIKRFRPTKPTAQQIATKKSLWSQLLWLFGCILLIGLLGLQYMLFNMDKVAKNPATANLAHQVCGIIQCRVPSAQLSSFQIDATLQNQKDIIIYISNKSSTEQLFPYLLVQLKDKNGMVVADFVADTKDYLSESQTTLLANQYERIMLSTGTVTKADSVTVTPFYERP